jgi:hypothetical protein
VSDQGAAPVCRQEVSASCTYRRGEEPGCLLAEFILLHLAARRERIGPYEDNVPGNLVVTDFARARRVAAHSREWDMNEQGRGMK